MNRRLFVIGLVACCVMASAAVLVLARPAPARKNGEIAVEAEAPGLSAQDVERQLAIPLERALFGLGGEVRSLSLAGRVQVSAVVPEGADRAALRAQAAKRVEGVVLPRGVSATLPPEAAPLEDAVRYTLEGDDLTALRSHQDWEIARALKTVPGVAGVATCGGAPARVEVRVSPDRMQAHGATLDDVVESIRVAGGSRLGSVHREAGFHELRTILETRLRLDAVVSLQDVASAAIGPEPARCLAARDGKPVVLGMVLLRRDAELGSVREALRAKLLEAPGVRELTDGPGVRIEAGLARDTTLELAGRFAESLEAAVRRAPEVVEVLRVVGPIDGGPLVPASHPVELRVRLEPGSKDAVLGAIAQAVEGVPGLAGYSLAPIGGLGGPSLARRLAPIELAIGGAIDLSRLEPLVQAVFHELAAVPGLRGAAVSPSGSARALDVSIDREAVAKAGLAAPAVEHYVAASTEGIVAGSLYQAERTLDIRVFVPAVDLAAALDTVIPGQQPAPLSSLITVRAAEVPVAVLRAGGARRLLARAFTLDRDRDDALRDLRAGLQKIILPTGVTISIQEHRIGWKP